MGITPGSGVGRCGAGGDRAEGFVVQGWEVRESHERIVVGDSYRETLVLCLKRLCEQDIYVVL